MKITKLGHCALVIEVDGAKLLTDPGNFTIEAQEALTGLDAILITHEHADHLHVESVTKLVAANPSAVVVGNASVANLLKEQNIACVVVGDGEKTEVKGVVIEGFGTEHATIYNTFGLVENTGYLIADRFYFPGDNFHDPKRSVDVLALPLAGPWVKFSSAIEFARSIKARVAFGVHDGMILPGFRGLFYMLLKTFVPETESVELKDGETREF